MTGGDARRGRRDNGLVAADYAAAGDVDPRVGEHLLDVLGLDGIAAYLRPSTDLHPVTWSSSLPDRPTDRLYVDRAHLQTARTLLAQLTAEAAAAPPREESETSTDFDDAWAEIVAGFHDDAQPTSRSWPEAEDVPTPAEPPQPSSAARRTRPSAGTDDAEPSLLDALDTFGAGLPDEDEGDYNPPTAPPVPRPSLSTALSLAGIVFGLLVFLKPDLLPFPEAAATFLGFAALVSGFVALVWRLRPGDNDDIDPDDGARV